MKREGFAVYMVMVPIVVFLAIAVAPAQAQQASKRERLQEIENYIANRRQAMNRYYQNQINELTLRAEKRSKQLEQAEEDRLEKTDLYRKTRHLDEYGFVPEQTLLSDEEVAQSETDGVQRNKQVAVRLEMGINDLEKCKQLTLQRLQGLEEQLRDDVLKPEPEPTYGVVTGIVYSDEQPLALVDGQVVREGQTVHGVRVVKILRRTVEFEKGDTKWEQRVRQTADSRWQ